MKKIGISLKRGNPAANAVIGILLICREQK